MNDREDALSDIAYADGFRAGWNAAMDYNAKTWTDAEIAALEDRLSKTPDFLRLQHLKRFRQMHLEYTEALRETLGGLTAPSVGSGSHAVPPVKVEHEDRKEIHINERASPTDLIIEVSCKVIGERNHPMAISDLHAELTRLGIVVGGREPQRNLSTKLSGSDRIYNEKSLGWWLTSRKSEMSHNAEVRHCVAKAP